MSRGRVELAAPLRSVVGEYEVSSAWFRWSGVETCETAVRMGNGPWMIVACGRGAYDEHDRIVGLAAEGRPWRLEAWIA